MSVPSPKERPDLYDGYDCQPRNLSDQYRDSLRPDYIKKMLAERKARKADGGKKKAAE